MKLNVSYTLFSAILCSMVLGADGHWWWWWGRWHDRCQTEATLTIVSSECAKPLSDVKITSWRYMEMVSSSDGEYTIKACRLPLYVRLRKSGFRTMWVAVRHSAESFTMTCRGSGCTAEKVYASVTSDCNQPLEGVNFTSAEISEVFRILPGFYRLTVCSLPAEVTSQKSGFESMIKNITGTSVALQMSCTGQQCGRSSVTLTVQSSDCLTPVNDVTIISADDVTVTNAPSGVYTVESCNLPVSLTLLKPGFESLTTTVLGPTEVLTLNCADPLCTTETVTVSVSSECQEPLVGVTFTSPELMDVSSLSPGIYMMSVCVLPQEVSGVKSGYEPVTQMVSETSVAMQMTCNSGTCGLLQKTISVLSSDCSKPVSDVNITSPQLVQVTSNVEGSYVLHVCSLPVTISLEKDGFISTEETITTSSSVITLPCDGTTCTTETATVSVTSDCTPTVMGVAMTSSDIIATSSSAPGTYEISVCLLPTVVTFERTGYAPLSQSIVNSESSVSLTCIVPPVITEDPQSKYRAEGENVKLCCQAEPASAGLSYKWFKDGTEIAGQTSNELTLTNLNTADAGFYKCSAKSTVSDTLPAAVSQEALLTITANSDDCTSARVPREVELVPGCRRDIGRCENRACRSDPSSAETCSDDNRCCEETRVQDVNCGFITIPSVTFVIGCSCSCSAPTVSINGLVVGSDTDAPIAGIKVTLNGGLATTATDANGEFSFSIPSALRRVILKATDSTGNYIDSFSFTDIPSELIAPVSVDIVMIRKAPVIQIDPTQPNQLAISGTPSDSSTGVASIMIPVSAFFTSDGTPFNGKVFVSLTFLDPQDPELLDVMPGRFVTLNTIGEERSLVTQGVFSISFEDITGNTLITNGKLNVFGTPGFALWEFDQYTATWIEVRVNPGRKRRQVSQQQFLGSFNPQNVSWYNIDRVYDEPDCFFKLRAFENNFSPSNEILTGLKFIPKVSQILASGTEVVKYYFDASSTSCVNIKCPAGIAQAKISVTGFEILYGSAGIRVPLLPATVADYSGNIRSELEVTPYFYSLLQNDTTTIFVNTALNESGPFYPDKQSCINSTIDDNAFWFTKESDFIETDFDDDFESRCVAKIEISLGGYERNNDSVDPASLNLTAVSLWGQNSYGARIAEMYNATNGTGYSSCFEYRCSRQNESDQDITTVLLGLLSSNFNCYFEDYGSKGAAYKRAARRGYGPQFMAPILDPAEQPSGFFFSNTSSVQAAMDSCLADQESYVGQLYCYSNDYYEYSA